MKRITPGVLYLSPLWLAVTFTDEVKQLLDQLEKHRLDYPQEKIHPIGGTWLPDGFLPGTQQR